MGPVLDAGAWEVRGCLKCAPSPTKPCPSDTASEAAFFAFLEGQNGGFRAPDEEPFHIAFMPVSILGETWLLPSCPGNCH